MKRFDCFLIIHFEVMKLEGPKSNQFIAVLDYQYEIYKARFTHSREWRGECVGGSLVIRLAAHLAIRGARLGSQIDERVARRGASGKPSVYTFVELCEFIN